MYTQLFIIYTAILKKKYTVLSLFASSFTAMFAILADNCVGFNDSASDGKYIMVAYIFETL